jgi:hydroxymethylpyrimidine pyrophosphatase-like HAD family hydrolase
MMIAAFAVDYDGTLAQDGRVAEATSEALRRLKASGAKLLLVTGRELPDLQQVFPRHDVFDVIVAENGALLYWPERREEQLLAAPPPAALLQALERERVAPLSIGRSIVATWRPNETKVLEAIRASNLEWHIVFNKDAVMALPAGVNKASGLAAALDALEISPLNVVAVGDAENDHALLTACGYRAAVANAVDALKREADIVTEAANGRGIAQLVESFLRDPASALNARVRRHDLPLGRSLDGARTLALEPNNLTLISGGSSGGKSRLAVLLMERIAEHGAQLCAVDPEGDYERFEKLTQLGDAHRPPTAQEALQLLQRPQNNVVLNLMGIDLSLRPQFFTQLSAALAQLRARSGRPHWIVVDEAHHVIPAAAQAALLASPRQLTSGILISSQPESLSRAFLNSVRYVLTVGTAAVESLRAYCEAVAIAAPKLADPAPRSGQALFWDRRCAQPPRTLSIEAPSHEHQRHIRKYAQGNLGDDKSFYFRGSSGELNLRAQNLTLFLQMADGVDDGTWLYHLKRHDYSRWFNEAIKDEELASSARQLEDQLASDAMQSRRAIRELIARRYTAPSG